MKINEPTKSLLYTLANALLGGLMAWITNKALASQPEQNNNLQK